MAWNTLPSLVDGNTPTHTDLNKFIDNLEWMHNPPSDSYFPTVDTNLTTVSTNWASISSDFEITISTSGGYVFFLLCLHISNLEIDIDVNGTRLGSTPASTGTGLARVTANSRSIILPGLLTNLSAGSNTLKAMWKATSGTGTISGGFRPRFFVREL